MGRALLALGGLLVLIGGLYAWPERYDPTLVILPEGYRGPLVVIFDQPDGDPAVREGGRRRLRADSSGVVVTAFPPTFGRVDEVYVSERPEGRCLYPPAPVDVADRYPLCSDSIRVWLKGTGSLGTGPDAIPFADGYVGTVADAESLRTGALPYAPAETVRRRVGLPPLPPGVAPL